MPLFYYQSEVLERFLVTKLAQNHLRSAFKTCKNLTVGRTHTHKVYHGSPKVIM